MESWRKVWRTGIVPLLTKDDLIVLRDALRTDDQRLLQRKTTVPPPFMGTAKQPITAACALGFCGWAQIQKAYDEDTSLPKRRLATVEEVDDFFGRMCGAIDERMGMSNDDHGDFLNAYDGWTREEMINNLLPEVETALETKT